MSNMQKFLNSEGEDDLDYEKKLDSLEHEFKISVTKELSGEVLNVCNLSAGVYNRGVSRGVSLGEIKKAKETAYRLHRKGMSTNEIADMVDVSVDKVTEWLAEPQTT